MKFSERIGIKKIDTTLQTKGINEQLRNSLWNVLDILIWQKQNFLHSQFVPGINEFCEKLWFNYFKKPIDTIPYNSSNKLQKIRDFFFKCEWYEVYDFLEFVLSYQNSLELNKTINSILEREFSGYRYIKSHFVQVTDKMEIEAIEMAINEGPFKGVHAHLKQALGHLSRKEKPDYRNSIKESISAVESMAREITNNPKATLGDALTFLEKNNRLHPALKKGFTAIYGYTSDEEGIRHAMLDEPKISVSDAKFFLVSCSTFINYLKSQM